MAHIQKPREITALSARLAGSARHKLYVHLGGGLRAVRIDDATRAPFADWRFLLYPVVGAGGNAAGPYGMSEIRANTAPHGLSVLGVDDVEDDQAVLRMRMWYPMSAASGGIGTGADLWSNVSINQPEDADARDVALARYLAFSLRAAGIRIRDASDQYHKQLKVALARKTKDSARFSNVATDALFVKFEACAAAAARGCGISFDIPVVKVPPTRLGA